MNDGGDSVGTAREGPLRPPLAIRVGVVGHRPPRLLIADPGKLKERIREILETIKSQTLAAARDYSEYYSDAAPLHSAISALAEGADRFFAQAALEAGYSLGCVLPFARAEYEKDFAGSSDSQLEFAQLLRQASSTFELDGKHDDEVDAYGVCGRVVLNQSDLLVVVWDGDAQAPGRRYGGYARRCDAPWNSGDLDRRARTSRMAGDRREDSLAAAAQGETALS